MQRKSSVASLGVCTASASEMMRVIRELLLPLYPTIEIYNIGTSVHCQNQVKENHSIDMTPRNCSETATCSVEFSETRSSFESIACSPGSFGPDVSGSPLSVATMSW